MSNSVVKFLPATDIYALGATLYKLLSGTTPPDANLRISGEELAPLADGISSPVKEAILTAMELNKAKRPQTVSAFLGILDSVSPPEGENEETTVLAEDRPMDEVKIIGNEVIFDKFLFWDGGESYFLP